MKCVLYITSILLFYRLAEAVSEAGNSKAVFTFNTQYPFYKSVINVSQRSTLNFPRQRLNFTSLCKVKTFVNNYIDSILFGTPSNDTFKSNLYGATDLLRKLYFSFEIDLKYGSNYRARNEFSRPLPNYKERIRYYDLSVQRDVLEILMDFCIFYQPIDIRKTSEDFFSRNFCAGKITEISEENFFNILKNSCANYIDQLRQPILKNLLKVISKIVEEISEISADVASLPDISIDLDSVLINGIQIRRYNIIPLELIHTFFSEWSKSFTKITQHRKCIGVYFDNFSRAYRTRNTSVVKKKLHLH